MGAISIDTARWLFEDARSAFHDADHPCHIFKTSQGDLSWEQWQLPVPFLGRQAERGILFVGANPSYGGELGSPTGKTDFESYLSFWTGLFDGEDPEASARLYLRYAELGRLGVGDGFRLGTHALIMDAVPYRSRSLKDVWSPAMWSHVRQNYTLAALRDCAPTVVVTCGSDALWCLRDLLPGLAEKIPDGWRLRDWMGRAIAVSTDWGNTDLLPLPHLTSARGITSQARQEWGVHLQEVLSAVDDIDEDP